MTKWRRAKTQIKRIRDEKGNITTNTNKIQRIMSEYFENLYSSKLENLDKMDKFLHAYNQPKLNQEDINHLIEIEAVIESPTKESPGPDEVTGKCYQTFKEEITLILLKLFQEIEREGTLPNSVTSELH
jgi:hypothetical protein